MTDVPVGGACFFDAALSSALVLLLLSFHPPFDIPLLIRPCISPVYLVSHQHTFHLRLQALSCICVSAFFFTSAARPVAWRARSPSAFDTRLKRARYDGHGPRRGERTFIPLERTRLIRRPTNPQSIALVLINSLLTARRDACRGGSLTLTPTPTTARRRLGRPCPCPCPCRCTSSSAIHTRTRTRICICIPNHHLRRTNKTGTKHTHPHTHTHTTASTRLSTAGRGA